MCNAQTSTAQQVWKTNVNVCSMLIDYKNVTVCQDDKVVLEGVDFHVDEGEFVYLIGKVGSGKSSLLKTTYCELDIADDAADKAEVLGRNLKALKRKEVPALRREMGIIFQDFQLLHDRSVHANLLFVLQSTGWKNKAEAEERIEKVLTDVGMLDHKHRMPYELSGGEQQRTGNLDGETAANIVGLLRDIAHTGTAVVMSTHNIGLMSRFPGVVYQCADGQVKDVTATYSKIELEEEG